MYRNKCKSFIILNDKKEILKYDSSHNHPEKEYDMELKKSSIPYGIKIKPIYNKISKEMRFICSDYNSIKSQISRNLNKNYHPTESEYYKTKEYNDDIFVDGKFFIAPKFSYQIFITRTYAKELDTIPSYYELIDKLNELEHVPYYDYQRKIRGIWKIKKRAINKYNEISVLIERYKNIETKLIDTKCDRNNTINLLMSPPYNMGECLTAIPVRPKKLQYRSTLYAILKGKQNPL
ncbi:hypothetical protein H8356DRAFT_1434309 [Neocallimastix lanati (nom. inval.)]|nr:hypothetical protein H8356DRAFT_1434309 [Neocallimastix sp. JGI-2020a]